jgi:spore maturation protein CgeB
MKILFLESHPIWMYGLPNGLKEIGHTVMISGPISRENIYEMIDMFQPDLILSMGWTPEHSNEKHPWIKEAVKQTNIPLVYWATEDPLHTLRFTLPLIGRIEPDFVFTVTPSLCKIYEKLGVKVSHLDFSYHESIHRRITPLPQYRCDIAVVANAYPDFIEKNSDIFRASSLQTLIAPLIQKGIRVDFWGNNWDKMGKYLRKDIPHEWIHGYLDYTEAYKVYSSAKIVIGLQNCEDQLTQRTYEILGSGGFLLTSDTAAVRAKFRPGHDLIVSSSPEETLEQVQYYLKNYEKREEIQRYGQQAVKNDSYRYRAEQMLEVLRSNGIIRNTSESIGQVVYYIDILKERYELHHIASGETLWQIARMYNVSLQYLIDINNFESDQIFAGQIMKVRKKKFRNIQQDTPRFGW